MFSRNENVNVLALCRLKVCESPWRICAITPKLAPRPKRRSWYCVRSAGKDEIILSKLAGGAAKVTNRSHRARVIWWNLLALSCIAHKIRSQSFTVCKTCNPYFSISSICVWQPRTFQRVSSFWSVCILHPTGWELFPPRPTVFRT